jgi:ABC-type uncharacterized transport system permease subunit
MINIIFHKNPQDSLREMVAFYFLGGSIAVLMGAGLFGVGFTLGGLVGMTTGLFYGLLRQSIVGHAALHSVIVALIFGFSALS